MVRTSFVAASALFLGLATAMPAARWLEPLAAQSAGGVALWLARAAALAMLVFAAPALPRRRRAPLLAAASVALLGSVVVNALAWALVALACLAAFLVRAPRSSRASPTPRPALVTVVAAALALVAGVAVAARERAPKPPRSSDDRVLALEWEARDNPFRALPRAQAWAASEASPGEGALCLARVAHRLDDDAEARRIAHRVLAGGASEDVKARARALLAEFDRFDRSAP
jgi:hypothetical protein